MRKFWKYIGITVVSFIIAVYVLFLIVPFFLTGVINSYNDEISALVEKSCGFKLKLENMKVLTTPKLTVGAEVGHAEVALPTGEKFVTVDNVQAKMSLIPLIAKRVEIDMVGADNLNINLKVKKDGRFLLEDYIPQENQKNEELSTTPAGLPLGFKLSNHLPNIILNNYNVAFIDMPTDKTYSIFGDNVSVRDFILDKKIKIAVNGKAMMQDKVQFNYDIKLLNKIMPQLDLNDIVFASNEEEKKNPQDFNINLIDIFKAIYKNRLTADVKADVKTSGTLDDIDMTGYIDVSNLSVVVDGKILPASSADIKLKGNGINLYTKLYTAENELTELIGVIKTGKHPKIDLNCKSNAKFQSIFDLLDSVAKSFDYNDFDTLTATGGLDADFTIKSNLKNIESSGYLKIPSASIAYKLYNAAVNNIGADIDFANNVVNIKRAGLSILGQPLKISGSIKQDATADLLIIADKLQLKGLLLAVGQMALLKENKINSGTLSMSTSIKGRLDKIVPKVHLSIDNVNLKNIPSNTTVKVVNTNIDLTTDGKKTNGLISVSSAKVINPMAVISAPTAKITFGEKDININNAYILLNNSRIDITGKVADYTTKNLKFNINAKGNLLASDIRSMIPADMRSMVSAKGKLPLSVNVVGNDKTQDVAFNLTANPTNYVSVVSVDQLRGKTTAIKGNVKINGDSLKFSDTGIYANGANIATLKGSVNDLTKSQKLNLNVTTPSNIAFIIPGFGKSKVVAGGNIDVSGVAANPILKGSVSIPSVKIPEVPLTMTDMQVSLNGPIIKGNGTLKKFVTGGIVAENLASDFNLTNNVFYLKNLSGEAFDGKINGNISYNISNGHIGVAFKGVGMDAEKAIAGSAGLKNALSGKLNFNANVTLHGATQTAMMKNLKGKASFDISDGSFGNIGRFENFLFAQNLQQNSIVKAAVNSVKSLPTIKNTAQFRTISGNMSFNNGWAQLNPVKTSGPSMSYYVKGRYNLLNATANVVILGRLSAEVVAVLGPLGDLSVSKLTSYIPKFGTATGNIINALTTNPKGENTASIPALSNGNKNYKDFKVVFNGGVESRSSVKSFKWLSTCDMSAIKKTTMKEQVKETKQAVKDAVQEKKDAFNQHMAEQKTQAQEANQEMKNAVQGIKNLKNLLK